LRAAKARKQALLNQLHHARRNQHPGHQQQRP
jgi:hypothetical protein